MTHPIMVPCWWLAPLVLVWIFLLAWLSSRSYWKGYRAGRRQEELDQEWARAMRLRG